MQLEGRGLPGWPGGPPGQPGGTLGQLWPKIITFVIGPLIRSGQFYIGLEICAGGGL